MKIYFLLISALLAAGCRSFRDEVKVFIPGTYTRFSEHEFGREYDTLVISLQKKGVDEYKIVRKWKYERVLDGKKIEPEYKRVSGSGVYKAWQKVLEETTSGDQYSFDVKEKLLLNGAVVYQKL